MIFQNSQRNGAKRFMSALNGDYIIHEQNATFSLVNVLWVPPPPLQVLPLQ